MVVTVEERWTRSAEGKVVILGMRTQRLLLEKQKDGVQKLEVLGEVVQLEHG